MKSLDQNRVPHRFPLHRKGRGIALCATVLFTAGTLMAEAQIAQTSCGLGIITDATKLIYPPIAEAAHVSGNVILIATFGPDGAVTATRVVSGPEMLRRQASEYVRGWKASPAPGTRNCPVVIEFRIFGVERQCDSHGTWPPSTPGFVPFLRHDPQHVTISYDFGKTCYIVQY